MTTWVDILLAASILVGMLSIPAMVIAYYLRCPHCGSLRGSYEDPPAPVEPNLLATDDPRLADTAPRSGS